MKEPMVSNLDGLGYRGATCVVTGGSSGMGEAVVRILGDLGAAVHVVDIQPPKAPHAAYYPTDLADPDQVAATAAKLREIGSIDFLFPCAGIPPHTLGALQCMLVNYVGTRQFIEAVLPAVKDGGGIAIISSVAGRDWDKNIAQNLELLALADPRAARAWCEAHPEKVRDGYTSSKEMLIVWAQHAAIELGRRGIRVNCTAPCPTSTAFMDVSVEKVGRAFFDEYPYPLLGRMATGEEQAWSLVLLNSPLNAAVSGAVLYTDQGYQGGIATGAVEDITQVFARRRAEAAAADAIGEHP